MAAVTEDAEHPAIRTRTKRCEIEFGRSAFAFSRLKQESSAADSPGGKLLHRNELERLDPGETAAIVRYEPRPQ
jgi:hypothetical protein